MPARRGSSRASSQSVVGLLLCLAALLLSTWVIYVYVDSLHEGGERAAYPQTACPPGTFRLQPGMRRCEPWLSCRHINTEVRPLKMVGRGAVKKVYLSEWNGHKVALSRLSSPELEPDFLHGLRMLRALQDPAVVQLVGFCAENHTVLTEFHPLGALLRLEEALQQQPPGSSGWQLRLRLALDYVSILHFLHNSPAGRRVMCDSSTLEKLLSQFLLTSDLRLVVNDLDALPRADGAPVRCGRRQLSGDFVAPEQRWPFPERAFDHRLMPGYDEKSDIWKVPDVTRFIMGRVPGGDLVHFHLFQVHEECKREEPRLRPAALDLLRAYRSVYSTMVRDALHSSRSAL